MSEVKYSKTCEKIASRKDRDRVLAYGDFNVNDGEESHVFIVGDEREVSKMLRTIPDSEDE